MSTSNDLRVLVAPTLPNAVYTYDGAHRPLQYQDPRGAVTSYDYDYAGGLARVTSPGFPAADGTTRQVVTTFTSPAAATLISTPISPGTVAQPAPALPSAAPRVSVTDAQTGLKIAYQVDGWGTATRVEAPGGVVTTATRDTLGRVTQTVDARGGVTTYVWNPAMPFLLDSTYDAAAKVGMGYSYDAANYFAVRQVRVGGQEQDSLTYSGGRLMAHRVGGPGQNATRYTYNGPSNDPRPTAVTDPRGHVTTVAYEPGGLRNVQSVTDAAGTRAVVHDIAGRDSVTTDPLGHRTVTLYDVLNRPTRQVGARGDTTTTGYDALYARAVTDAAGQVYRDSVGALGAPVFRYDPGNHLGDSVSATTYDAAGRVARVTNRRGQTVSFGYDPVLGYLSRRSTPDGADAAYGADSVAHLRWAQTAESVDSLYTDKLGRDTLAVHRVPSLAGRYTVRAKYDSLGRRIQVLTDAPDSYLYRTYGYDRAAGVLDSVSTGGALTTLGYNDELATTVTRWPNGVTVTDSSTAAHALGARHYSAAALDAVLGRAFGYDNGRHVTARFNATKSVQRSYAYDAAGQLTGVQDFAVQPGQCSSDYGTPTGTQIVGDQPTTWSCAPAGMTPLTAPQSWSWDAVGNPVGSAYSVDPNSGNRLRWYGPTLHSYDADGNLFVRQLNANGGYTTTQRLSWNSVGQLTGVWNNPQGGTGLTDSVTFGYDGWGRRVRKTDVTTGVTTYFVWDGDDLVADADASGHVVAQYAYYPGIDQPHSVRVAPAVGATPQTYYYATEPPGHVTGLIDGGGGLAARYTYQPFGVADTVQEALGGWTNRLRFGAREYDAETGLSYNRARYYDPWLQRFLSPDPIGLQGGINPYAYAGNDPVNSRDPSGLDPEIVCDIGETYWGCGWWDSDTGRGALIGQGTFSAPSGQNANPSGRGGSLTGGTGNTGGPGGPGGGGPGTPAQQPVNHTPLPYTPLPSCPAALSTGDVQEALQAAMQHSTRATPGPTGYPEFGGVHVQVLNHGQTYGHYGASGNTVSMPPSAPAGATWWFHDHPNTGTWGSFVYAQGPSVADAVVSNRLGVPGYIISHDSLFVVQPNGSAVGCHR